MKNYRQNIITFSLGVAMLAMLTSSPLHAEEKEGVVRISDNTAQTIRQKKPVQNVSFSQQTVASTVSSSLAGNSSCQSCNSCKTKCTKCECKQCNQCNECNECRTCRPSLGLFLHQHLGFLGFDEYNIVSRMRYYIHGDRCKECEEDEFEFDENGNRVKVKRNKGRRYKRGHYTKVYAVNPWYSDPRNGRVYAAKNYGMPMTVPLAPNVEHEYNYGWGIPSSRLTPISKPPARSFQPPFPARRYPVDRRHPYRIETEKFPGRVR